MSRQSQRVYNGRYEIVRPIARGGMAEVYLARDQLLDRPVALKVLFPELSTDPNFVERFRREAQAAANLSHPNIISVYDWGEEDGTYFIVMEYVDGAPLSSIIRSEGALLPDRAAAIGASVAAALAFAHRNGVVHRDVKPGNILIDANEQVKIGDFGIARAASAKENLTQTGAVMGTATYFSPEQAQGMSVDQRSDVYSLGVVLYEMVTGRPPFTGDNPVSVAYKHVREEPPTVRDLNPSVPQAFASIVAMAMAKDAANRYATAEDLRGDLLRFRQGRPVSAPPAAAGGAAAAAAASATAAMPATSVQRPADGTRAMPAAGPATATVATADDDRRTSAYLILLFVMLALLAVLLFLLGRSLDLFGTGSGGQVEVPAVVGQPVEQATQVLEGAGLEVRTQLQESDADVNTVFRQDPVAGQRVEEGSEVTLFVSEGPGTVQVPDVTDLTEEEARRTLEEAGFAVTTEPSPDDEAEPGTVVDQEPSAGTEANQGATVTITVSTGRERVPVPNVAGKGATEAANELGNAGFRVSTQQEQSSSVAEGNVIRTSPAAGTELERGSTVTMVVSSGQPEPEQVTVPNVIGRSEQSARSMLQQAGLRVNVVQQPVANDADDGIVIDQTPDAGEEVDEGSTVTIRVGRAVGGGGGGGDDGGD